jgi:hypothetical protein
VIFPERQFHLVKKQDGSFVALSWRSTHLGCTVPWRRLHFQRAARLVPRSLLRLDPGSFMEFAYLGLRRETWMSFPSRSEVAMCTSEPSRTNRTRRLQPASRLLVSA